MKEFLYFLFGIVSINIIYEIEISSFIKILLQIIVTIATVYKILRENKDKDTRKPGPSTKHKR